MSSGSQTSPETSPMSKSQGLPHDTLIIFDWDDTLLCTSAINASKWELSQLLQLERAAESCLRAAMKLGHTMIVTNGNGTWVEESSHSFVPHLTSTLDRIEVISARALYEHSFPGDPFAWKRAAFQKILEKHRKSKMCGPEDGTNLIVLGDSPAEMEAAHHAARAVGGQNTLVKTVKFKEQPSVEQLLGQLHITTKELEELVQHGANASKILECNLPQHLSHKTSGSSGWKFSDCRSWDTGFSLAQALFSLSDFDEDLANLEVPNWMLEVGDKLSSWQKSLLQTDGVRPRCQKKAPTMQCPTTTTVMRCPTGE